MLNNFKKSDLLGYVFMVLSGIKGFFMKFFTEPFVVLHGKCEQEGRIVNILRQANKLFIIIIGFLIFFILFYVIFSFAQFPVQGTSKLNNEFIALSDELDMLVRQPDLSHSAEHYLDMVNKRNIFSSSLAGKYNQLRVGKGLRGEINKILTVVGLLKDKDSKVIVEDRTSGETYFLSQGETFNGVYIKQIDSESVIVEYQGGQIVLSP